MKQRWFSLQESLSVDEPVEVFLTTVSLQQYFFITRKKAMDEKDDTNKNLKAQYLLYTNWTNVTFSPSA